ncbi:hypothetical protein BDN72DRAFT_338888 [Pluteus cervinus]|uniref:Uncharacterized protein n=1 Tax=Pluteus cervinus TaxID=181527 RepID=A0ACD3ABR8_9AGAR|nr:hypothetical protein BDN72DRAFT_338888 [Pluteus cervinus]
MQSEFKHDSATIFPVYECLKAINKGSRSPLSAPVAKDLQKFFSQTFQVRCPDIQDIFSPKSPDRDPVKATLEAACALHLRDSLRYGGAFINHSIKIAQYDSRCMPLIPMFWSYQVPKGLRCEFAEQILMCTSSAMDNPQLMITRTLLKHIAYLITEAGGLFSDRLNEGPGLYLLSKNYFNLKNSVCNDPSPGVTQDSARVVWEVIGTRFPGGVPDQVKPYFADLAWATLKRGGIRLEGWQAEAYARFFGCPNGIDSRQEDDPTLWWIRQLSGQEELGQSEQVDTAEMGSGSHSTKPSAELGEISHSKPKLLDRTEGDLVDQTNQLEEDLPWPWMYSSDNAFLNPQAPAAHS